VRLACRAGLDAWLLVPPHHLERTTPGARGGEGFVSADLSRLRDALAQTALEVRLCAAAAAPRGEVALLGLSLGALAAAWALTGPERVDAALLVAPPADLPAVLRETPIGRRYAALARRAGAALPPREALEPRLRALVPLDRRPAARRVAVACGTEDRIALAGPALLARAWGVPLRSYPRGHLTLILGCEALRRDAAAFLAAPPPA
jgi:pimeloyl-ACP methyl ester carboxylesterase